MAAQNLTLLFRVKYRNSRGPDIQPPSALFLQLRTTYTISDDVIAQNVDGNRINTSAEFIPIYIGDAYGVLLNEWIVLFFMKQFMVFLAFSACVTSLLALGHQ